MKRTKSKSSRDLRNISMQTENFDSLIEISKLEEQVRMLQLENDILRRYIENCNKIDNINQKPVFHRVSPQTKSKINVEKFGCGCKGNCSSRLCGCVKKGSKCCPLCKCNEKKCKNQESECNEENKENINGTYMKTPKNQNREKNEAIEKYKDNKSLFSPNTKELYKDPEESQFSDIYFSFDVKNTDIKFSQREKNNINNVNFKKRGKKENNDKEQEKLEKIIFDPMKPRHQLSRTPPSGKKFEKSLEIENIIQVQLHPESPQEMAIIPFPEVKEKEEVQEEEEVDWEKHTAQLIPCVKCKRTFLPQRIQKHQACCKKI